MKKLIIRLLVIALIVSAALGIGIVVLDIWNDVTAKVLFTTFDAFGYSILGLCCFTIFDKGRKKIVSIIGMIICLISIIYSLIHVWTFDLDTLFDGTYWRISFSLIILSCMFAHISLMLLINSKDKTVNIFKNLTILFISLFGFFALISIDFDLNMWWQLYAILLILIVAGTITTPLMNFSKKDNKQIEPDKYTKLEQLKKLLDTNAISEEEYITEKEKILNEKA